MTSRSLCMASSVRSATSSAVCCVHLDLRADAALLQFDRAVIVSLSLIPLRLQRFGAGIERLLLQDQLLIGDDGKFGARRDLLAFPDGEEGDRAAYAGASDHFMDGLDRADHRFLVGDVCEMDHEGLSGPGACSGEQQEGGHDESAHRKIPP